MAWASTRDSLWFIPGLLTTFAAILALVLTYAERYGSVNAPFWDYWFFGGGAEGVRGVLSAIAGGLITVTGVVFSITIVALQLASSQFTPRVLRSFTADRANQMVLGVFISTFTYTLLVLRTIRSASADREEFVPRVAVTLAVAFVLVSIGFLIFFINHAARSIQVVRILERVSSETVGRVAKLFPGQMGDADDATVPNPALPDVPSGYVLSEEAGYLQAVDGSAIFNLARDNALVIAMEPHIGDFLLPGEPLAAVWPAPLMDEAVVKGIRGAFIVGPERTPRQDVEFGIIEIADIAVRALSPGTNDPTTALRCIDRLGEVILAIGSREPPRAQRTKEGRVHYIARHTTLERATALAFDQIRHYGADNPLIANKLLEMFTRLERLIPAKYAAPLRAQRAALAASARHGMRDPTDITAFNRASLRITQRIESADAASHADRASVAAAGHTPSPADLD